MLGVRRQGFLSDEGQEYTGSKSYEQDNYKMC